MNGDLYDVYSVNLVNWLVRHGHYIIKVTDDTKNNTDRKVFKFHFNQRLKQDVEDFKVRRDAQYKVYSQAMANYLITQGFDVLRAADSDQDETGRMKMFFFEESDALHDAMSKFNNNYGGPKYGKLDNERTNTTAR